MDPTDDLQPEPAPDPLRQLTVHWFTVIGVALLAMGLLIGMTPVNAGDLQCGSPFSAEDAGSPETCGIEGGLAGRRATALALLGGGVVFLVAAVTVRTPRDRPARPPRWTLANRPSPAMRKLAADGAGSGGDPVGSASSAPVASPPP